MASSKSSCSVPDCERPREGLGYCGAHFQRVKKYGDPRAGVPLQVRGKLRGKCTAGDCSRSIHNRTLGLCGAHYSRIWRDPDADLSTPPAAPRAAPRPAIDFPDGTRLCHQCDAVKPLGEFHRDARSPLGRRKVCKVCRVARETERYWDAPEEVARRVRDFRAANPEHVRAREAAYYEANRDSRIEKATEQAHRRRASAFAGPRDRGISKSALRALDGDSCCYCSTPMVFKSFPRGERPDNQATTEHVLALSRGGTHTWGNCALACWRCNISKGARDGDWRIRDGHRLAVVEAAVGA